MLERALGLSTPEPVGWNLDLAEAIYFLANFTPWDIFHLLFSSRSTSSGDLLDPFSANGDEVAARQLGADRVCHAAWDALVCRIGQGVEGDV
jgi:hypothetical protein